MPIILGCGDHFPGRFPRILAWKFPSAVLFETLRTKLFEKENYPVYNTFTLTANEKKSKHFTAFKYKANEIHYYSPPEVFVEVDAPTNGAHDEPSAGTS
ncbi:hypothetical protein FNV43_RR19717 [Rhamnella rubrinervis]|uniref:Uncharacterized protein n=1 Tax=Rhamnella rubrinervis TaxID=2594499 RepID=A0A8K0DZB2_9ROSA|nr:hypothetical protein FNV43_RR19717 [Rhamnella rubrinervis]